MQMIETAATRLAVAWPAAAASGLLWCLFDRS